MHFVAENILYIVMIRFLHDLSITDAFSKKDPSLNHILINNSENSPRGQRNTAVGSPLDIQ